MNKYQLVVCGGTFDLLHVGHKKFLQQVFEKGERVIIGLTSDEYVRKHKADKNISSFEVRKKTLENFIKESGVEGRVEIVSIDDMYGPLLDPKFQVEAIAVTGHSLEGAKKINHERKSRGLTILKVIEIPLVRDARGEIISSSRIRKNLLLPSTLRYLLQDAWGEVLDLVPDNINPNMIVTVGDVTSGKFIEKGIFPKIMIIDNKVERKDKKFEHKIPSNYKVIQVENSAGTISKYLSDAVEYSLNSSSKNSPIGEGESIIIIVDGEEDLAVLPVLLYASVGFEVYYGQPGMGLVRIHVTEKIKRKVSDLIDKFEVA